MTRVAFLDRDGVINKDPSPGDYVKGKEEFFLLPGAAAAIKRLNSAGIPAIVVTNQSCVGKKIITQERLQEIHRHMRSELAKAGARIDDIYSCTHRPEENCPCMKPKPGLLLFANATRNITYHDSWMVGNDERDIVAGRAAGCRTILVGEKKIDDPIKKPHFTAKDLGAAVDIILGETPGEEPAHW